VSELVSPVVMDARYLSRQVEIVEGHETCSQPLVAFSDAPDAIR
jgi:hypothetical protein